MTGDIHSRPCSVQGCPGTYQPQGVVHTVRHHGEIIVIENVPAEVCSECGDVLFSPDTVQRIEQIIRERRQPAVRHAPVYQFA